MKSKPGYLSRLKEIEASKKDVELRIRENLSDVDETVVSAEIAAHKGEYEMEQMKVSAVRIPSRFFLYYPRTPFSFLSAR